MIEKFKDLRLIDIYNIGPKQTLSVPDIDTLTTLSFNLSTKWNDNTLPNQVLEYGKIPPLDVTLLHKKGITGKRINVAIIDQPLALSHPEYKDRIVEYKDFCPEAEKEISSMHGPAVTSLLAGKSIGSAPDVNLYYASVPQWLGDAIYESNALKWIMKINHSLNQDEKIKFVSVSAAPGNKFMRPKNSKLWLETVEEAKKEGILVVECSEENRFLTAGYLTYKTNEFNYGFPNQKMNRPQVGEVHVPNSLRTIAESYDNINFSYAYNGVGGLSWGIPYAVGILCLAQQVNNNLTAFELKQLLIKSASKNNHVINPIDFIKQVEMQKSKLSK